MREGSLEAPVRRPYDWRNPDFTDPAKLDAELRRVFEICHGCRRCFNLCDSFPRLFDLVDKAGDAEVAGVASADFARVVDSCTLCDLCFMTKCPYVPPHPFDVDFPHLMVRARATRLHHGEVGVIERQLTETDRNGSVARPVAGLANWATRRGNHLTRPLLEAAAGIHRDAELPRYAGRTLMMQTRDATAINAQAPAFGRKAAIFATCFANYNTPEIGLAARAVLAHNGIATQVVYPGCCGMPQLEHGDLARVAGKAVATARALLPLVDDGWDIVVPVPSCALMMKFEWPLILPDDADVARLAAATFDISEYVVAIAGKEGLAPGLRPVEGGIALHVACHARAQNMGNKGAEMLRLLPDTKITVVERCSGHGGAWGVRKDHFPVAMKVGKPTAGQIAKAGAAHLCSECPLAGAHLAQGLEAVAGFAAQPRPLHPIQIIARAYGLTDGEAP
jgi:glycerol-3-phosphate dehydrogenase subunit C